jgi:ribonuclease-3
MKLLEELEAELGYSFQDSELLKQALTHSSHAHEQNSGADNEQLEFLGDAVLGFVVSDLLYRAHPTLTEGQLSKLKGFFVSAANLVKYAEQLRLGQYLHLGKGEEKTGGRTKQALLVDGFEAILGAIYLDGGLDPARSLISRFFESQIGEIGDAATQLSDFKTALQQLLQSRSAAPVHYHLVSESGPDHQKLFTIEIVSGSKTFARGIGLTKKAAEQAAARQALQKLTEKEQEYYDRSHLQEIDGTRVL